MNSEKGTLAHYNISSVYVLACWLHVKLDNTYRFKEIKNL
jgi:hypothetical protein